MKALYWLIPIVLFALQALFTLQTLNQIRYEELAESVRNVLWLQHGLIYDGQSSNVGWFGLLMVVYNLFGFHLFSGKFVRLGLQLLSLFCLAALLRRYLGEKKAIVPLIAIGLSPTLLYFTTIQTTYGMDLQYLPICLFFLTSIDFKRRGNAFLRQVLFGSIAMIAWLSYPTLVYYLPALAIFYARKMSSTTLPKVQKSQHILVTILSFLFPLMTIVLFVRNRGLLWYDPVVKSGLFRGAGTLRFDPAVFFYNLRMNLQNLFVKPFGYYYELQRVDFSDFYPLVSVAFIFFALILLLKKKKYQFFLFLPALVFFTNIAVAYFAVDPTPGLRRYTGTLAAIYALYVWAWYVAVTYKWKSKLVRWIALGSLVTLPLHHVISYPINLSHLKDQSYFAETLWFAQRKTPTDSLELFVDQATTEGVQLACVDKNQQPADCRYSEIYAAVAASCHWNKLSCGRLLGYDKKSGQFIPLEIKLWDTYYFEH